MTTRRDEGWGKGSARRRLGLSFALVLVASSLLLLPLPALAQDGVPELREIIARAGEIEAEHQKARAELASLGSQIVLTDETIQRLDAEIGRVAQDRDAIRLSMIEAAEAQKRASAEIAASEGEVGTLRLREADLKRSLVARRGTLAQVLGALERMGRKPPPAILVHPDDALGSVRSAILLGSVVPSIRSETEALNADLQQLASLRIDIERQRETFAASLGRQREEELRLARLFEEKERLEADHRQTLEDMNRRTAELGGQASSLEELIGTLEADLESAREIEEEARRIAAVRAQEAEARRLAARQDEDARREREIAAAAASDAPADADAVETADAEAANAPEMAALEPDSAPAAQAPATQAPAYDIASLRRDMARLDISAPFSTLQGSLVHPVVGERMHGFGEDDGFGRKSDGMVFSARAGDLVTAPADGRILYSGPFRSYGQLLILNAGDGYHIVLAGMREIDVDVGQFVLAGEPVAVMGARRLASAGASDLPPTLPSLYVEFRKDGKPVDPAPWWTDGASGRTRNDS